MKDFINLTPHDIIIQMPDGEQVIVPSSGKTLIRVQMRECRIDTDLGCPVIIRDPVGVNFNPEAGKKYLVSSMVLDNIDPKYKGIVFAPDTGHTAIRDDEGRILAVTRLVSL